MPVTIEPGQLGARIRSDSNGLPKVLQRAMYSAAQRGRSWIIGKTPVDRGILKNAWRIVNLSNGVELINDQPYAGVIEQGARPFKVGRAGMEALVGWVKRKLLSGIKGTKNPRKTGSLDSQARSIAWAIAKTFEKYGIKGRRFVYLNLPKLAELMDLEINRYLDKFFNRGSGSKI